MIEKKSFLLVAKACFTTCLILLFFSCAELQTVLEDVVNRQPLTENEVDLGLREALRTGTGNSVKILSMIDGFYRDEAVKILLPQEAKMILDYIRLIPGGKRLVEDVILRLNRAAEYAVTGAGAIFLDAISALTLRDVFDILYGTDTAATQYLHDKTGTRLAELFQPKIREALDQDLVGNISCNRAWRMLTDAYNRVSDTVPGQIAGLQKIDTDLAVYVTGKALDGLFLKLGEEERKIRKEPAARVTVLLKKVFGQLDKR